MVRLVYHFFSANCFIAFLILLVFIVLIKMHDTIIWKTKSNKLWRVLCLIPLNISLVHFIVFNLHNSNDKLFHLFGPMYLVSLLSLIWIILPKGRIYKRTTPLILILAIIGYFTTFFNTVMLESVHNLTYLNYVDSFNETINILKKEYVLNDHKKIDYEKLYNKYISRIEEAEENKDEQMYFKSMYEFASEFRDGHVSFGVNLSSEDEPYDKIKYMLDYYDKDYGFGTILLSDGRVSAILVDEDSEAYNKGLRDGMIITKKDNVPVENLIESVITPVPALPVNEDNNLLKSIYLFATGNETISLSYINEFNEEITIDVKNQSNGLNNTKTDEIYEKIFYEETELNNLAIKMIDKDTGYIYIENEMYNEFKGAIGYIINDYTYLENVLTEKFKDLKMQGMKDLIIDLRGNTGGYFGESAAIASFFSQESYTLALTTKYNGNIYDKMKFKGNGKYSKYNVKVLVNSNTVSAGDGLTYMLSKCPNVEIIGFTNSNNSSQSVGGIIYLSNGSSFITYPTYKTLTEDKEVMIDPNETGTATVKLDKRIELNQESIKEIFNSESDYLLEYALDLLN